MKWCRFEVNDRVAFGIVEGDQVVAVDGSPFETWAHTGRRYPLARVTLLVPVVPQNFYAVGLNYRAHIEWAAQRRHLKGRRNTKGLVGPRPRVGRCLTAALPPLFQVPCFLLPRSDGYRA